MENPESTSQIGEVEDSSGDKQQCLEKDPSDKQDIPESANKPENSGDSSGKQERDKHESPCDEQVTMERSPIDEQENIQNASCDKEIKEQTSNEAVAIMEPKPKPVPALLEESNRSEKYESDEDVKYLKTTLVDDNDKGYRMTGRSRKRSRRSRGGPYRRYSSNSSNSNASERRPLPVRPGIVFEIGARLMARDKSQIWYAAKVVEIDDIGGEVKVHFDRWNSRYDQWFPMDSVDLKGVDVAVTKKDKFKVGDEILAKWKDQNMYPAKVDACYENGSYLVIFYDGFVCKMHAASMDMLPTRCIGKLKFPTLEEAKKRKKASLGGVIASNAAFTAQDPNVDSSATDVNKDVGVFQSPVDVWEILQLTPPQPIPNLVPAVPSPDFRKAAKEFVIEEDHNHFKCNVEGCSKSFRKEKLLESHYKHYHNMKYVPIVTIPTETKERLTPRTYYSRKSEGAKPERKARTSFKERQSFSEVKIKEEPVDDYEDQISVPTPKIETVVKPVPKITPEPKPRVSARQPVAKNVETIPPPRSSSRRVSLPAKFASKEICLMQPLGRERNISTSSQPSEIDDGYRKAIRRTYSKGPRPRNESILNKEGSKQSIEFDITKIKSEPKSDDEEMKDHGELRGPAVAKKIALSGNADPQKIEKMITIASSKKRSKKLETVNRDPKKSFVICSRDKGFTDGLKFVKNPPKVVEHIPDSIPTDVPRLQQSTVGSTTVSLNLPTEEIMEVSMNVLKEPELQSLPLDGGVLLSGSTTASSVEQEIMELPLKGTMIVPGQSYAFPPGKGFVFSPTKGHVMCTRRKEAILEKEKAEKSIGGHVMCTRKKSEKLAAVEEKYKRKVTSPVKGEPQQSPCKKRKMSGTLEGDSPATSSLTEPKQVPLVSKTFKVEQPDVILQSSSVPKAEKESAIKPVTDEVVNCRCGCWEESGLMMQCEICLTWQHGFCFDIEDEDDVPEKYFCFACINARGLRESCRYKSDQSWFKKGEMAAFPFLPQETPPVTNPETVQRNHALIGSAFSILKAIRSINHKINIVSCESHPDLACYHKPEDFDDTENEDKSADEMKEEEPDIKETEVPDLDVNKHELTSQNLVTFDHSYYSPGKDIIDLDEVPLIIDYDLKSTSSKGDTTENFPVIENSKSDNAVDGTMDTISGLESEHVPDPICPPDLPVPPKEEIAENLLKEVSNMDAAIESFFPDTLGKISESACASLQSVIGALAREKDVKDPLVSDAISSSLFVPDPLPAISSHMGSEENLAMDKNKPVSETSNFYCGNNTGFISSLKKEDMSDFAFTAKCKRNLMDEIKLTQSELFLKIDDLEEKVTALEKEELDYQVKLENTGRISRRGIRVLNCRRVKKLMNDVQTAKDVTDLFSSAAL